MAKKAETISLIDTFSEFKETKNIDRTTMVSVLEESFRSVIAKMFGTDENYDVIVNPDKGDFEIYRNRVVGQIHDAGMKAGVTLNPATPICVLEDIICDVDLVLLMSVNPGFGGQKFIPHTFEKVRALREMIDRKGSKALIQVDGGVGLDNWKQLREAGADVLVAGSAVYGAEDPMAVCEIMSK